MRDYPEAAAKSLTPTWHHPDMAEKPACPRTGLFHTFAGSRRRVRAVRRLCHPRLCSVCESLVRIDQVLLAGGFLAVDRNLFQSQRLRE